MADIILNSEKKEDKKGGFLAPLLGLGAIALGAFLWWKKVNVKKETPADDGGGVPWDWTVTPEAETTPDVPSPDVPNSNGSGGVPDTPIDVPRTSNPNSIFDVFNNGSGLVTDYTVTSTDKTGLQVGWSLDTTNPDVKVALAGGNPDISTYVSNGVIMTQSVIGAQTEQERLKAGWEYYRGNLYSPSDLAVIRASSGYNPALEGGTTSKYTPIVNASASVASGSAVVVPKTETKTNSSGGGSATNTQKETVAQKGDSSPSVPTSPRSNSPVNSRYTSGGSSSGSATNTQKETVTQKTTSSGSGSSSSKSSTPVNNYVSPLKFSDSVSFGASNTSNVGGSATNTQKNIVSQRYDFSSPKAFADSVNVRGSKSNFVDSED